MTLRNPTPAQRLTALNHRRYAHWTVAILVLLGILCAGIRYSTSRPDQALPTEDSWQITYRLEFEVEEPGAQIHIAFPHDTANSRVYQQNLRRKKTTPPAVGGLKTSMLDQSPSHSDRELKITASREGKYQIMADFGIHSNREKKLGENRLKTKLTTEERNRYLTNEPGIQIKGKAVVATFNNLYSRSMLKNDLVSRFFEHCQYRIRNEYGDGAEDAEEALRTGKAECIGKARAFVALCRLAGIPARMVKGLELKETNSTSPHVWAEAILDGKWKQFDPKNGYQGEMPHHYLILRRGRMPITRSSGITNFQKRISISEIQSSTGFFSTKLWPSGNSQLAQIFDLRRLPLELHPTLAVLLLFPLAALMTAIFRTIVGVDTVGSFTPALLALSFVYTGWQIGILVLILVVVIGLVGRAFLDRLKLLLLPRLSVVLTLVVLGMILGVSVIEYFAFTPTSGVVLLPMVITTMIVERFYVANEEEGTAYLPQLLAGTLVVAFFCYLILNWQVAGQLLLRYPELHFFTMAALILLGGYRGYRLMEVWRFRDLR